MAKGLATTERGGAGHPEGSRGLGPATKFTVVLETGFLNFTELGGDCHERGLFPEQVDRRRQAAQYANAKPLLTMSNQKDLQRRHQEDQHEIKRLQQELRRKGKPLTKAAASTGLAPAQQNMARTPVHCRFG